MKRSCTVVALGARASPRGRRRRAAPSLAQRRRRAPRPRAGWRRRRCRAAAPRRRARAARAACARPSRGSARPRGGCSAGRSRGPGSPGSRSPSRSTISVAHGRRGGRGEGEHRRAPERLDRRAEPQVLRPEVVAPLGDAVRLVDHEQRRRRATASSSSTSGVGELLGREEDELERVLGQLGERGLALGGRDGRVELRRAARRALAQVVDLVALERDQRRDDDGRARAAAARRSGRWPTCPSRSTSPRACRGRRARPRSPPAARAAARRSRTPPARPGRSGRSPCRGAARRSRGETGRPRVAAR